MAIAQGEALTTQLNDNLDKRVASLDFDFAGGVQDILQSVGASLDEGVNTLTTYGRDPIIPSVARFGAFAGMALTAKSAQIASIWAMKTGRKQDIHCDLRKALRRFSPFIDNKWETVNGYTGAIWSDPNDPVGGPRYQTKDGLWVAPTDFYPGLHNRLLTMLGTPPDRDAIAKVIAADWTGEALEKACVDAGLVMPLSRSIRDIMAMDVYTGNLRDRPFITIEKIADSPPKPFSDADTVLGGIRALGCAHVIAGPSIGRALALHGADVLNVWKPSDWEHNVFYYTAHVGMRAACLDIDEQKARARFDKLMSEADIFFSNRRPHWLDKRNLTAKTLCNKHPGLIHTRVVYAGEEGEPWGDRVGFDFSSGHALGLFSLEGTDATPVPPPVIHVVNDYISGWLATVGTLQALKRRAVEGGSYRVVVSLSRVTLYLLSLGLFDKDFAQKMAGSSDEHSYIDPDLFYAETPLGTYRGLTEQIEMSLTPGSYRTVLAPRGASHPVWID